MPEINVVETERSTLVAVALDRRYEPTAKTKALKDAVRELQKEIIRRESLAF